jgi:phosphoserine phosphatase RsbU/P
MSEGSFAQLVGDTREADRLRAVARYRVLGTHHDEAFDRIARMAARVFGTRIATVSIVDADTIWFKAAHGLEGVEQIRRDPGLAGSAILEDGPYLVRDALADPLVSKNPLVRGALGIRFYVGVPIVTADGYRLGTVDVLDTRPHQPTDDQVAVLIDLAATAMDLLELGLAAVTATRSQRSLRREAEHERDIAREDRDVARIGRDAAERELDVARIGRDTAERERDSIEEYAAVLQRTLLPPSLPDIPGLNLAAHYHPASRKQVGGDFYDVFAIGPQRWAYFLGDVEGHGASAAAVTSLIRYTLRSAALHHTDPVEVLAELNEALIRDTNEHRICTVLFGTLQASDSGPGFEMSIATGGHLPALLLDAADNSVREIRSTGGMLVGAFRDSEFEACSVRLRPGQTLLFFTDGLVETRNAPSGCSERFGEDELAGFAAIRAGVGAEQLIDELAALAVTLQPRDDVALLAIGCR